MPTLNMTMAECHKLATDQERVDYFDKPTKGLALRVTRAGTKTWAYRYRRATDGKRRTLTLSEFPSMTVDAARLQAGELRAAVAKGADPAGGVETKRGAMTFQELAEMRLTTDANMGEKTKSDYHFTFKANVYPEIGDVAANEVTADMVARIIDNIEGRGKPTQADRTKAAIGGVYKWAMKHRRGGVNSNPTKGLGNRAKVIPRDRVPTEDELARIWKALETAGCPLDPPMRIVVKLAMLTGQRREEICGARLDELRLDAVVPVWTIAGTRKRKGVVTRGRTKNTKEKTVVLSPQVVALFREAIARADGHDYVFPPETTHVKSGLKTRKDHMHPESVSRAMRRVREKFKIDDITLHDMRRAITSWLDDHDVEPRDQDLILGHQDESTRGKHYLVSKRIPQLTRAMCGWADHVWQLTGQAEAPQTNVVQLAGARA